MQYIKDITKVLIFNGKITEYEADEDFRPASIKIGEDDVVDCIDDHFSDRSNLVIGIADETFQGDLYLSIGWGYSEYTGDSLEVNEVNLLDKLRDRIGETVTMYVSNKPINILDYEVKV